MHLICPTCSASYEIDAGRWPHVSGPDGLPAPRASRARCQACGHIWVALPEQDIIDLGPPIRLPAPDQPASEAVGDHSFDEDDGQDVPARRRWPWLVAAVVALPVVLTSTALLSANAGLWHPERHGIHLPPLDLPQISLPQMSLPPITLPAIDIPRFTMPDIRLPAPALPPLSVEADAIRRPLGKNGAVWEVTGQVRNPSAERQSVPPLEVVMLDAEGQELSRWTIRPDADILAPGEAARFETSAINPPAGSERVKVRLKPPGIAQL